MLVAIGIKGLKYYHDTLGLIFEKPERGTVP